MVQFQNSLATISEVNDDPEIHPEYQFYHGCVNTIGILSCCCEGRRIVETLSFQYQRVHCTEGRMIRIFHTKLHRAGAQGSNFNLYRDGDQTRSFWNVDDWIEGMFCLTNARVDGPMNFGNPEEFSIR